MKTVKELVVMLSIKPYKLRRAARKGLIRGRKRSGRWMLNLDSVIEWIHGKFQMMIWDMTFESQGRFPW